MRKCPYCGNELLPTHKWIVIPDNKPPKHKCNHRRVLVPIEVAAYVETLKKRKGKEICTQRQNSQKSEGI